MTFGSPDDIHGALQRLGTRMLYEYVQPISLVVCGGGALNALNIARRTTRDVDVLTVVDESQGGQELQIGRALPQDFVELVAKVGGDLGLEPDWLNLGPRDVLEVYGVPEGMTERWERREYGPSLVIYFIHRLDQIHLKVLAAADPKAQPRHLEDLMQWLRPSEVELQTAVDWLLNRETSAWFRGRVRYVAVELGHDQIAANIPE